jgi:hypothetical protein
MSILNDPYLESLLDRLHERSQAQSSAIREHYDERDKAVGRAPEEQARLHALPGCGGAGQCACYGWQRRRDRYRI